MRGIAALLTKQTHRGYRTLQQCRKNSDLIDRSVAGAGARLFRRVACRRPEWCDGLLGAATGPRPQGRNGVDGVGDGVGGRLIVDPPAHKIGQACSASRSIGNSTLRMVA